MICTRIYLCENTSKNNSKAKCAVFKDGMSSLSKSGWPIAPLLEDRVKAPQNGQEVPISTINYLTIYMLNTTNNEFPCTVEIWN
jgi:biotin synthase-related radical SAM superfamily protein